MGSHGSSHSQIQNILNTEYLDGKHGRTLFDLRVLVVLTLRGPLVSSEDDRLSSMECSPWRPVKYSKLPLLVARRPDFIRPVRSRTDEEPPIFSLELSRRSSGLGGPGGLARADAMPNP